MADEIAAKELPGAGRNLSLVKAFDLLESVATHPGGASVAVLARDTGLPRATVTRLLASLADAGAVVRAPGERLWVLGPTLLRLSQTVNPLNLRERARPLLIELAAALQETVFLAVRTGPASVRVVEEFHGPRVVAARGWAGEELTTPASGFVRLALASLPPEDLDAAIDSLPFKPLTPSTIVTRDALVAAVQTIREQGHVVVVDEFEDGLAGTAVPLREHGRVTAMIAVYMPTSRYDGPMREQSLELLLDAADRLTR